jgi:uncharacterized membrane protein
MAGQSPDPSYQPSGQDQALTQGRPAWQQPSYPPPAYIPPGEAAAGQPGYQAQEQAYPGQDQTYTSMGQGQDYQNYQGYQAPGYGAQQGQGAGAGTPQWQGIAGVTPGAGRPRTKPSGERGFVGSLFDFSFSSFVTPKIIRILYVLVTIWTGLIGLTILIWGFKLGGVAGGLFTLIIIEPIFLLLTLGIYRVVLEAFMVIFRIYEETKKIRESNESQG